MPHKEFFQVLDEIKSSPLDKIPKLFKEAAPKDIEDLIFTVLEDALRLMRRATVLQELYYTRDEEFAIKRQNYVAEKVALQLGYSAPEITWEIQDEQNTL